MDLSNLCIFQICDLRVMAGRSKLRRHYCASQNIKDIRRAYTCQKHFLARRGIGQLKPLRVAFGTRGLGKASHEPIAQHKFSLSI
jgi:hypothetical protein